MFNAFFNKSLSLLQALFLVFLIRVVLVIRALEKLKLSDCIFKKKKQNVAKFCVWETNLETTFKKVLVLPVTVQDDHRALSIKAASRCDYVLILRAKIQKEHLLFETVSQQRSLSALLVVFLM